MARTKVEQAQRSLTVSKAIRVLRLLAEKGQPMGVTEIARHLEVYPSVASRLVMTLEENKLLRQDPQTLKYALGVGLIELGTAAIAGLEFTALADPVLRQLNEATKETVFLMTPSNGQGIYLKKIESPQRVAIRSEVGTREYLHSSGLGKSILAFWDDDEVNKVIDRYGLPRFTPNTITDPERLRQELAAVRQLGYAIDNEEGEEGIRCIGAPVFDHTRRPIASISISGPSFRTTVAKLIGWSELLLQTTRALSRQLGF